MQRRWNWSGDVRLSYTDQKGTNGNQWQPAPLLVKLANEGGKFNA